MKFGFIGAGKVGFTLGKYFTEKGIEVVGYYSKSSNSSKDAAAFTATEQFLSLSELINSCDAIIITTPDSEIKKVWNQIKELSIENKLICHCSGLLSSEIFSDISKLGAYAYSIHPMFAVSDKYNSYKNFQSAFITIEGNKEHLDDVLGVIKKLGNNYKVIDKHNKKLYHLASVMSSNLVLGLINDGISYLEKCGFKEKEAMEALYPLIVNNVNNIKKFGPINSLTGPLERADADTMSSHLSVMPKKDKELYKVCSRNLLGIAKEKNPGRDYEMVENLLGKGEIS